MECGGLTFQLKGRKLHIIESRERKLDSIDRELHELNQKPMTPNNMVRTRQLIRERSLAEIEGAPRCCDCRNSEHENFDEDVRMTIVRDGRHIIRRGFICHAHRETYEDDGFDTTIEVRRIKRKQ